MPENSLHALPDVYVYIQMSTDTFYATFFFFFKDLFIWEWAEKENLKQT